MSSDSVLLTHCHYLPVSVVNSAPDLATSKDFTNLQFREIFFNPFIISYKEMRFHDSLVVLSPSEL